MATESYIPGSAPMATTSTKISGAMMQTWRDKRALERLNEGYYPFYKMAPEVRPIPKGEGKVVKFFRWENLAVATTALTEGIHPISTAISATSLTCGISQYGRWLPLTDLLRDTAITDVQRAAMDLCGDNMWASVDAAVQRSLFTVGGGASASLAGKLTNTAGFHVFGAAGGKKLDFNGGSPHFSVVAISTIGPNYIRQVTAHLKKLSVRPFAGGAFKAIVHTNVASIMRGHPTLKSFMVNNNASPGWISKGDTEAGHFMRIEGVDIYETNTVDTGSCRTAKQAGVSTVYPMMIFGRGAYGRTEISNAAYAKAMSIIVKNPGPNDTSNPLNLYSTVGWKALIGAKALNASCGAFILIKRANSAGY